MALELASRLSVAPLALKVRTSTPPFENTSFTVTPDEPAFGAVTNSSTNSSAAVCAALKVKLPDASRSTTSLTPSLPRLVSIEAETPERLLPVSASVSSAPGARLSFLARSVLAAATVIAFVPVSVTEVALARPAE